MPIEAHEWGVSVLEWSGQKKTSDDFPDFFYTAKNPGKTASAPKLPVKDMEADSGIRVWTKPVLYFYGTATLMKRRASQSIPLGVEIRFQDGEAIAWWPQVNTYRNEGQTRNQSAPDLEKWNATRMERYKEYLRSKVKPNEFEKVWAQNTGKKFLPFQLGFPPEAFGGMAPFPDDLRFQLIWDRLELRQNLSEGIALRGGSLPETNWVQLARQTDSDYVTVAGEAEKFLFYEGKTQDLPGIAFGIDSNSIRENALTVCNISDDPIHDVFMVYRNKAKGRLWARYIPKIEPVLPRGASPPGEQSPPHIIYPAFPDFNEANADYLGESDFLRWTELQLSRVLRMDPPYVEGRYQQLRNPAQFQPPTLEHRLFAKEVIALQRIWNKDFFENEGLTVIYREAREYLDRAVPLRIYTDNAHYVNLSRCSLVVNRGIDLKRLKETEQEVSAACDLLANAKRGKSPEGEKRMRRAFQRDPMGTITLLAYRHRMKALNPNAEQVFETFKREFSRSRN